MSGPRKRQRLSIRASDVSHVSRAGSTLTSVNGVEAPHLEPDALKKIYASCIDLFQAHKITVENAFQIKFLELMGDIIEMPEFDRYDMLGAGRMLETGAKIYVCRVDKTKHSVMDLASTLNMQQKNNKRKDGEGDEDDEDKENVNALDDNQEGEEQPNEKQDRKKRRKKMKEDRFLSENSKISLTIEVDSCKGGSRRAALKTKFQNFIENDMDFDYYNEYVIKNKALQEVRPLELEDQQKCFGNTMMSVPSTVIDLDELSQLQYLPFTLLENFDKNLHTAWGKLLADQPNLSGINGIDLPVVDQEMDQPLGDGEDMVYVPQEQPPPDYNQDILGDNFDDGGFENVTFVNDDGRVEGTQEPPVNPKKLKSMQEFFDLYNRAKSQFGWCGPLFVKPQRFDPFNQRPEGPKRPRPKKDPIYIDVLHYEKKTLANKFLINKSSKSVFDERGIEKWSAEGRPPQPYLETDEPDDDYEEVLELAEDDATKIPILFKYFGDLKRHLFSSLNITLGADEERVFDEFNRAEDEYVNAAGFEVDRHHEDDFFNEGPMDDHDVDIPLTDEPFNLPSFTLPVSFGFLGETEGDPSKTTDGDSIRFTKKPKPIDMHSLKRAIRRFLEGTLKFSGDGTPQLEDETQTDFISLVKYVFQHVDKKTVEHLTVSIIVVGLLHVVVDKKLFLLKNLELPVNPYIVCRGSRWVHKDNIPMPFHIEDD